MTINTIKEGHIDHIMVYRRTLPDLSGRLSKAQNHHHSHHPFDALIRFALRMKREDIKSSWIYYDYDYISRSRLYFTHRYLVRSKTNAQLGTVNNSSINKKLQFRLEFNSTIT